MATESASTSKYDSDELACNCIVCNLLLTGFATYNLKKRTQIILKGRPTPFLTNLIKQTKWYVRHFQIESYKKCEWLTGCDTKSLLFCWPCLLFSNENNLWNKNGFSDLNNLHKLMKRHSSSKSHIRSIIKERTFAKARKEHVLVDDPLRISNEQHNQLVRKNREILKRLIDVVCFLGEHELGFRGHVESENSSNKGNYADLINLLAKYDEPLKIHLENSIVFKGTSNIIQNDLISCIREVTLRKIKNEIEETLFIAIMLDETTDVANGSQLSKVVRYVTRKGEIKERFLGFFNISTQRTATAFYNIVQSIVDELNAGSKLVAQSYDGVAVMASELGELQTKVRETYPNALVVDCMAHSLNLVLQESVSSIKECKVFFSTLNGMASFFSKSSKRASALDLEVHKRMPKVVPTRWDYDGRLVLTVFEYRQSLIDFFEKIIKNQQEWDCETVVCSRGYLHMLKTESSFNLLLLIFSEVFPFCDKVFAVPQNKSSDINFCLKELQKFKSFTSSKRDQFDRLWNKFEELNIQTKAIRTDVVGDEKACYGTLFSEIIDNIITHMDARFKNMNNLRFIELIQFNDRNTIPEAAFESLKQNYSQYFEFSALRSELSVIYNTSEGINKSSVSDLWKSIKECELDRACPEILKLCELTLTIPAKSASTERSFSACNRIKNFIENSTTQDGLSNLALFSIEKELIKEISLEQRFYDDIIDEFSKQSRPIPLTFK